MALGSSSGSAGLAGFSVSFVAGLAAGWGAAFSGWDALEAAAFCGAAGFATDWAVFMGSAGLSCHKVSVPVFIGFDLEDEE